MDAMQRGGGEIEGAAMHRRTPFEKTADGDGMAVKEREESRREWKSPERLT